MSDETNMTVQTGIDEVKPNRKHGLSMLTTVFLLVVGIVGLVGLQYLQTDTQQAKNGDLEEAQSSTFALLTDETSSTSFFLDEDVPGDSTHTLDADQDTNLNLDAEEDDHALESSMIETFFRGERSLQTCACKVCGAYGSCTTRTWLSTSYQSAYNACFKDVRTRCSQSGGSCSKVGYSTWYKAPNHYVRCQCCE
jgi:hypothetical protein